MLLNRFYYEVKPWIPNRIRLALRRMLARRILKRSEHAWPILESAGRKPDGWPGWPDKKQFAFVLTHDVESQAGLANVKPLAELEMSLGFRSSFNFIPEGSYTVPPDLRAWLTDHGFEIGVHDLHHDGKLFRSRDAFRKHAVKINQYLDEWNAVGFRAGFMLRQLDWLHDLNIQYDSSTFDTDPFEPQPDGAGTIFPFWVPQQGPHDHETTRPHDHETTRPHDHSPVVPWSGGPVVPGSRSPVVPLSRGPSPARGYLELPYTLPQDSTLFLLLRESSPAIWIKKLDWIAAQAGMALLDTHPDYMAFDPDSNPTATAYPARFYTEFLQHCREHYSQSAWITTPRQIAGKLGAAEDRRHGGTEARSRGRSEDQIESGSPGAKLQTPNSKLPPSAPPSLRASVPPSLPPPAPPEMREQEQDQEPRPPHLPSPISHLRPPARPIWIDLDNTPHVPFFEPIIEELERRGHRVVITARDAFQVCELADQKRLRYTRVGRHHGKHKVIKFLGLFWRATQLVPTVLRHKPRLGLSHGSRSQAIACNLFRIPVVMIADYEYAKLLPLMHPTWEMVPEVVPNEGLYCRPNRVRKYPGIKEDVYVDRLKPDPDLLSRLGLNGKDIIVTVRPPATEAHYHNPESEKLFVHFMDGICRRDGIRVVLLPRNLRQGHELCSHHPHWFIGARTVIPEGTVDGLNLLWHSDLVVSGGGTMNREAAALGVPVYSIFRGRIGAVDHYLQSKGRLVLLETTDDVDRKIEIRHRQRSPRPTPNPGNSAALSSIVDHLDEILRVHYPQR